MKKILFLTLLSVILFSCEKETPTTYQIINNCNPDKEVTDFDKYLDGSIYSTVVFCFNDEGEIVRQDNIGIVHANNSSDFIKVTPDIVKVKVSYMLLPEESEHYNNEANIRKYTLVYFYLTPEQNTDIIIDNHTMIKGTIY